MARKTDTNKDYGVRMDLTLEKINAQRISSVESDIKDVRRDVQQLMRELPHIVQEAVSQAVSTSKDSGNSSIQKNGNGGNGIFAVFITIILSLGTIFGQQIYFNNSQNEKTKIEMREHINQAYDRYTKLVVLENEIKWIKYVSGIGKEVSNVNYKQ